MNTRYPHKIRIISGKYKGKLIPVAEREGLRPTPDRLREIIFSWLEGKIENKRVLDLFAGSGVLGFEAISRGAAALTLVELNQESCIDLEHLASGFTAGKIRVIHADALKFLETAAPEFDLVFLDPPYKLKILEEVMHSLQQHRLIHQNSLIYTEMRNGSSAFFPGYELIRENCAGQVKFSLWKLSSF